METLADRLRQLMRGNGIKTQSQLARRTDVAQSIINRILRNPAYAPSYATMRRLADSFGVSVQWLVSGDGPAYLPPQTSPYRLSDVPAPSTVVVDSRMLELVEIFERLNDVDRSRVLEVMRMIDRPRARTR